MWDVGSGKRGSSALVFVLCKGMVGVTSEASVADQAILPRARDPAVVFGERIGCKKACKAQHSAKEAVLTCWRGDSPR